MMDGMSDAVNYQCKQFLSPVDGHQRYFRIEERLFDVNDEMDDASERNLRDLGRFAERLIQEQGHVIEEIVGALTG